MPETTKYRLRLRVRLAKAFNSSATSRTLTVAGREVTILSQERDQPLSDTTWIVLRVGGLISEEQAWGFGRRLRDLAEFAGLCCRLGIDVGEDRATSGMSEAFARERGLIAPDERLAPNIHGLAVLPDDDKTRIPIFKATGTVRANPEQFLSALAELGNASPLRLNHVATGVTYDALIFSALANSSMVP